MRVEEKLAALANHHEHISKCVRVTMVVLAEAENRTAQKHFGHKVRKALTAKKSGDGDKQVKLANGDRMRVTTAAVLRLVHSSKGPVPMTDVREMLLKEFNKTKAGQAVRVLVQAKYIKKTSAGLVPGNRTEDAVAS